MKSLFFKLLSIVGIGCVTCADFKFGLDMLIKSYDAVCWFEALKQFPNTNAQMFTECGGSAEYTVEYNGDKLVQVNTSQLIKSFADAFEEFPLVRIPKTYAGNCSKYLLTPFEPPPHLEGQGALIDVLNDHGIDYPYKAFSYCMMNQLQSIHGEVALKAVMSERTHGQKDWLSTFIDRDNEFRARHKTNPFEIVKELSEQAQKWADKMASECKISYSAEVERQWNGKTCGENLASVWIGMLDEVSTAAYAAAATWYEQFKSYPWETGFKDDDIKKIDWNLFGKIRDFTQMIWGNSKMVGYGYSYNATCAGMGLESRFMVARYYPAGNTLGVKGQFKANVQPFPGLLTAVLQGVGGLLGGLLG